MNVAMMIRRLKHRAVLLSATLITLSIVGVFFAYGQIMMRPPEKASPVPFNTIYHGNGAQGYSKPADLVIDNQSTCLSVWDSAFCSQSQCPPLPDVNFTSRTVIAAFYGLGGHSNNGIGIDEVTRTTSTLDVHVVSVAGGNCGALIVTIYPAHIVDVPKTDLHVSFSTK